MKSAPPHNAALQQQKQHLISSPVEYPVSSAEKVVCDFGFWFCVLKQPFVYEMAQENCTDVRMETENVFQHAGGQTEKAGYSQETAQKVTC